MRWSPFDMHIWVTGPTIVLAFVLLALGSLRVAYRFILPRLRIRSEDSEFSGGMLLADPYQDVRSSTKDLKRLPSKPRSGPENETPLPPAEKSQKPQSKT